MSDTAAFFANKKKKKKAFKFNANKIDASSVTSTVHVDAPALSTDGDVAAGVGVALSSTSLTEESAAPKEEVASTNDSGWDDTNVTGAAVPKTTATSELLDMKALEKKRYEEDDIAERMRVEATKAKLAAAREGMEREAQRLKEEAEQKKAGVGNTSTATGAGTGKPRFGAAAAASASSDGKWLPPHMRSGGGASLSRVRMGAATNPFQKLDTQDENLFPDLNTADQILEQQKQQQQQSTTKVPKKTGVGGGATWGSSNRGGGLKPAAKPAVKPAAAPPPVKPAAAKPAAVAPVAASQPKTETAATTTTSTPAAGTKEAAAAAGGGLKKKKKKKKDLSTFKAGGS